MTPSRAAFAVLAALIGTGIAPAQVKEPPRADKLDVQIRYRIRADRDERVRQFRALEQHLAALGFDDARKNDPDRDLDILDPNAERFTGTISSAKVMQLLDDPRVLNILFAPAGHAYPDAGDKPVAIRVITRGGIVPAQHQLLHGQVLAQLQRLGFRESLGYDTRGYTQLKGTIPYRNLNLLVKDLRGEPGGWFLSDTPVDQLPRPFADRNPIRWVEVMAVTDPPAAFAPEVILPARAHLAPDLRARLADPAAKETPLRVEVVYEVPMEDRIEDLRAHLSGGYGPSVRRNSDGTPIKGPDGMAAITLGASVDGVSGNIVTIRFDRPSAAERFAAEPGVLSVRMPRVAIETVAPLPGALKPAAAKDILDASGAEALHRRGYSGAGVKVVVIGSDFTGAEKLIGTALPKTTRVIDFTSELNPDFRPLPADLNRAGNGTAVALAAAVASPNAEFVLVRIDPGSFFQLGEIVQFIRGEVAYTEAMRSRLTDITNLDADVAKRRDAAAVEYRAAFADLSDDEPARTRRARAKTAFDALTAERAELVARADRFTAFQKAVASTLTGTRVVVNSLQWESGYPLDSLSELSRTLEKLALPLQPRIVRRPGDPAAAPKPPLVWVQAASTSGAAVWGGPFLDANRDGTMEFAPSAQPLPAGAWTREFNFLGLRPADGATANDLPAGTRVRFTIQWREPRHPNTPPDVERPIYTLVLRLFRQLDPSGEKRPSDELIEVARSVAGPYPVQKSTSFVVYEQILDFTTTAAGSYALGIATGDRAEPFLPALRREAEIYPRIFAETLTGKPTDGRVVFRSFATPAAGVGTPADSIGVVTVGAPMPGALIGGGTGLTLRAKPDLFGPDSIDLGAPTTRGNGIATGFAGGVAAVLVQGGASGSNVFRSAGLTPGKMIVVPEAWVKYLRPIARPEK